MLFLSLLLLPFLSQILTTLPVYRININSNTGSNNNNTLTLTKGQFHPITIEIHSISNTTELQLQTTYLTISDSARFIMPLDKYYINTSDTLSIRTFIGINCSSTFTDDELLNGVQIYMESENASFEPQYINVTILTNQIQINLTTSDKTIGYMSNGIIYPQHALFNTNPITIQFEVLNETYQETLIFNNNLTIKPSFDMYHYYSQSIQFYSRSYKVTSDILGIQVRATLTDNECYTLSNVSSLFELNINSTLSISNITNSNLTLETHIDNNNTLYISTVERGETSYGPLWCVLISENVNMVTDNMIINQQYPFTPEYKNKIYYFQTTLGELQPSLSMPLNYIDKYCKYKWKCIHKNNAVDLYYSKQKSITSTTSLNKDTSIIQFGYPSCWDVHFRTLNQSIIFDDNLGRYASMNVYDALRSNYNDNGCVKFAYRNITAYYPLEAEMKWKLKSLCIYSEPACNVSNFDWKNMSYTVKTTLRDVFVDANAIESVLGINNVDVAYMKQIDFVKMNATLVTVSTNVAHNKSVLQVTLYNRYTEPIECYYNLGLINDVLSFKWGYNKERKCVLLPGRNDDNIITLSFNAIYGDDYDYDNKTYAIELLCNSLPGLDVTDILDNSFKVGFSVVHNNNYEYNCTVNKKSPYCLQYMFNPSTYNNLSTNIKGIDMVLNNIEQYKHKTYTKKESALTSTFSQIQSSSLTDIQLYPLTIQLDEYIALIDCGESPIQSQCITLINEYENITMNIIERCVFNSNYNSNIYEYLRSFAGNKTMKHILTQLLIKTLSLGNAVNALTAGTCRQALSLSTSLLYESNNILQLLNTLYYNDSDYTSIMNDITSLYVKSVASIQRIIAYMDVNDFISISGNAEHMFFIEDTILTSYTTALSFSLINIFIRNNNTVYTSDSNDIVFKYIQFNTSANDDNETALYALSDVVTVKINHEQEEMANVKGMGFVLYKTYPLVSVVKDDNIYGDVYMGMNVVLEGGVNVDRDYMLWDKVEIVYNRSVLGINVSYCYLVKDGKLTNENVYAVVNDNMNTLSCYVECIGDIIISVDDIIININDDNMWWLYVLITIIIGLIVGGLIACMFNWKRFTFEKEDELLPTVEDN